MHSVRVESDCPHPIRATGVKHYCMFLLDCQQIQSLPRTATHCCLLTTSSAMVYACMFRTGKNQSSEVRPVVPREFGSVNTASFSQYGSVHPGASCLRRLFLHRSQLGDP